MLIISTIPFILTGSIIGYFLAKLTLQLPESQTAVVSPKMPLKILRFFHLKWAMQESFLRYFMIISTTALAFALCWIFLSTQKALLGMIFVSYLIPIATIDIEQLRIPNSLNLYGFLSALLFSMLFPTVHNVSSNFAVLSATESLFSALAGAFIGSGCLLWIAILAEAIMGKEPLGMGDIKLIGVLGAFCGWKGVLFTIFGGSLIASSLILSYQFIRFLFKSTSTPKQRIPFGFWLSLASFLYLIWFQRPFEEYLQSLLYNSF